MRKINVVNNVQLLGVPWYGQGSLDGLCAYYSAAMMLSAFYPYKGSLFGESTAEKEVDFSILDPLIANYKGPKRSGPQMSLKEKDRKILSRWFYSGENLKPVTNTLNEICRDSPFSTHFKFELRSSHDKMFRDIRENIDNGLPVMLGWDTKDLGAHAVLVVGYWQGTQRWFSLNDPSPSGMNDVSWDMLKEIKKSKFQMITCDRHYGPRPDKLVIGKKEIENGKKHITYRWTPENEYADLEWMFEPTNFS